MHLPVVKIGLDRRRAVCSGRKINDEVGWDLDGVGARDGGAFRIELGDELLAIYRVEDGGGARAEVVLCDP